MKQDPGKEIIRFLNDLMKDRYPISIVILFTNVKKTL